MIDVQDLDFSYQNRAILQKVTFQIEKGQFVAIIGPNGGGKTTCIKLLAGLLRPSSGSISIEGKSPKSARSSIGYVPQVQLRDLLFPITVFELILSGLPAKSRWFGSYDKEEITQAEKLLEQFKLEEHRHINVGQLSGGLMQRALIARVLISDPEVLLLDEPTANIDPFTREQIFQLLFSMKGKKTICLVTHDLKTVIKNVSHILCIEKTATCYPPEELCEHFTMGLYHTPLLER